MVTTSEPQLEQRSKTETTVRQFDTAGKVISETTTVITHSAATGADDLPLGMYL